MAQPFECKDCGRRFTRNENLKRHEKTRETARRHACEKCGSHFARRDVCKRHQDHCTMIGVAIPAAVIQNKQDDGRQAEHGMHEHDVMGPPSDLFNQSPPSHAPSLDGRRSILSYDSNHPSPVDTQIIAHMSEMKVFVSAYFLSFHPALPVIHKSTFDILSTPQPMLKAMSAIGAIYTASAVDAEDSKRQYQSRSLDLWKECCNELEHLIHVDQQRIKTTWVLTSWLLCVIYGTFSGQDVQIHKSRGMYRSLIDMAREHQLLYQRVTLPTDQLWSTDLNVVNAPGEKLLRQKWSAYVAQEYVLDSIEIGSYLHHQRQLEAHHTNLYSRSMKLAMYAFYLLDYHLFVAGNMRPMLLSTEFEWDIPWAQDLWNADNVNDWWSSVSRHEKNILPTTNYIFSDPTYRDKDFQTKSVLAATQALLSNTQSERLVSILEASPFATLCIVTNLDNLLSDFTRCYYQLPPNLTDPSPFHVLTQRQNSQFANALRVIWKMMKDGPCAACSEACTSLWHAVRIGCLSIKVSMSKPDDLLVGGIVESNPTAGLATASHLTLGNYVTARRSGHNQKKAIISEDGIMVLLDDLLKAMFEISASSEPPWEAPWTFIQAFKLLLVLWKALRLSIQEIELDSATPCGKYPNLSRQGRMVAIAVKTASRMYTPDVMETIGVDEHAREDGSEIEAEYMRWMHSVCNRRATWDIGFAMSDVLDEIATMTTDPVSLRQEPNGLSTV